MPERTAGVPGVVAGTNGGGAGYVGGVDTEGGVLIYIFDVATKSDIWFRNNENYCNITATILFIHTFDSLFILK